MFSIFYCDTTKDFLEKHFNLDYQSLYIENEILEAEGGNGLNNKRIKARKAIKKHKNKSMNNMIKNNQFPSNITKFNKKLMEYVN